MYGISIIFCNSLSQKYGLTVIFSTHDVSLVPEIADYVYVMNKGSIVASGTIEEIFVQMEMLQSVRLDVPVLPKLIRSLQEHGVDINMGYTYEEVEKVFLEAFRKKDMIEELFDIERYAYRDSIVHRLDARVKIIVVFAAIIAMVSVPYSPMVFTVGAIFLLFFAVLWGLTRLSPLIYLKRALLIVPLWGIVILFQIFL